MTQTTRRARQMQNAQNAYVSLNCRINRDLRDRAKLRFASALLGESFASRMFRIIRDERGLCYIAHTGLMFSGDYSVLSNMMDVDKMRIHEAIGSLVEITGNLATNLVPESEFAITKDYVLGKMDLDFDNPFSLLFLLASHAYSGGFSDLRSYYKELEHITIEDFHAWCQGAIQRKNLTLTVDGCATGQEKQVEESWDAARA
nr:insulinase family protein [Candidatus Sigynarchaeota archaeon]